MSIVHHCQRPPSPRHRVLSALWLFLLVAGFGSPVWAVDYVVTNSSDSGPGSLREAMNQAVATPDTHVIVFDPAIDGSTIVLDSPLPPIPSNVDLTIAGNGSGNTIIDGADEHRPFLGEWANNMTLTLSDLTIRNARADGNNGGAIEIYGSNNTSLTVERVEFVDNSAEYEGGAIRASVPTHIENSVFDNNEAGSFGGAIAVTSAPLTVHNSSFTRHRANVAVIRLSGDIAPALNGRFVNLTLTENFTDNHTIEVNHDARLSISNSVVGIHPSQDGNSVNLENGGQIDTSSSFNNVIGSTNDPDLIDGVNGNQVGVVDPLIGPLADYGGPTRTLPLLPGSPAINAGTSAGGDIPNLDQRGIGRVGEVDVGAFESRGFVLAMDSGSPQSAIVGAPFAEPLMVAVSANESIEPVEGGQVQFSAPATGPSADLNPATASIASDGRAQTTATANPESGGPYTVTATLPEIAPIDFSLSNLAAVCADFSFPYTLTGSDNAARVAELRQAIECANGNATEDEIDLGGFTLTFSEGPFAGDGANALPVISSVIFLSNGALERDAAATDFRFLMVESSGELVLRSVQLRNGQVAGDGGAILADGGLMTRNSVFENNAATGSGGAIRVTQPAAIVMTRFSHNRAPEGAALAHSSVAQLVNVHFDHNGDADTDSVLWGNGYSALLGLLFHHNELTAPGSSLMVFGSLTVVAEMRHGTIADNSVQGPLLRMENGNNFQLRNSILWNNQSSGLGDLTPVYSILPGAPPGNGNLDVDPDFVTTPANYRLAAGSPAIDAGDNSHTFFDIFDVDDDGDTSELLPDLDLGHRPWDDPDVPDIGNGTGPLVDIGVYERQPPVPLPELAIDDVSLPEGDSGTSPATFTISLSDPAPPGGVAFDIATADDTAIAGEDYVAKTATPMVIAAGQDSTTFTVEVLGDTLFEPDETFFVNVSNATNAIVIDDQGLGTILNDDDAPGITVVPTSGLVTTEGMGPTGTHGVDRFSVVLESQPTADVTIALSSSDTTEGTVSPNSLTFTAANWDLAQNVDVLSVDDNVVDGDIVYTIITAPAVSDDANYDGLDPDNVTVTNIDNDVAGIMVIPTSGLITSEAGGSDTFTVALNTQPSADVTMALASSDTSEGTVSPNSLTFTAADWNVPQTVTVTGVDDDEVDGDIVYTIITGPTISADVHYDGIDPDNVSVTNTDDDTAGISINPTGGLTTTEAGGSDTFTVVLNTQPSADVTMAVASSDTTEGTVSPNSLTFTATDWNVPQTVTVTGVDDDEVDGDIVYTIITGPTISADIHYDGIDPDNVSVTNTDDDSAGISINPTSGLTTTEAGGSDTFTVALNTQPSADVTMAVASSDTTEGTVSPNSLTFTAADWNVPQTVTVTGVDDDEADGDVAYTVSIGPVVSDDPAYDGIDPTSIPVINQDNDDEEQEITPIPVPVDGRWSLALLLLLMLATGYGVLRQPR